MKRLWGSVIGLFIIFLFQNCSPMHEGLQSQGLGSSAEATLQSASIFESTLHPILQNNCAQCHGVSQIPRFAVADPLASHDALFQYGLVDLTTPSNSRLVSKIAQGHQGFSSSLSTQIETAIQAWADGLLAANPGSGLGGLPPTPVLEATFSSIHSLILVPKCVGCHSPTGTRRSEDYSDYQSTLQTGKIVPGNANGSEAYQECVSGSMPEGAPRLSDQELAVLKDWINAGALNN
ncbi:MAG: hypothetical protein KDD34_08105 [Bdellovibrionales bacterium]|nr:hypothetical protein [Bdellovibrionales bacterium]